MRGQRGAWGSERWHPRPQVTRGVRLSFVRGLSVDGQGPGEAWVPGLLPAAVGGAGPPGLPMSLAWGAGGRPLSRPLWEPGALAQDVGSAVQVSSLAPSGPLAVLGDLSDPARV